MSETAHHQPTVVERPEQTCVAVRRHVRMDGFVVTADRLPEILGWPTSHGAVPAGPPFFRFHTVDLGGEADAEAGVPVDSAPAPGATSPSARSRRAATGR